jgi:phosphoribulokinase
MDSVNQFAQMIKFISTELANARMDHIQLMDVAIMDLSANFIVTLMPTLDVVFVMMDTLLLMENVAAINIVV